MKRGINWEKVILAIIFMICSYIVLKDLYMITIHAWITGQYCGWTLFGFITFIIALITGIMIFDYFMEN